MEADSGASAVVSDSVTTVPSDRLDAVSDPRRSSKPTDVGGSTYISVGLDDADLTCGRSGVRTAIYFTLLLRGGVPSDLSGSNSGVRGIVPSVGVPTGENAMNRFAIGAPRTCDNASQPTRGAT
ncbi:hypothetical protein GCM10009619_30830 [Williamsia maris]